MTNVPSLCNVYPKLHYIVGPISELEQYQEHNGIFYEEMDKFQFDTPQNDLIAIPNIASERTFGERNLASLDSRFNRTMQYYEYMSVGEEGTAFFDRTSNIFRKHLKYNIGEIKSYRDIFTFPISENDDFVSITLMSIMMYKKANGIVTLSEEDYKNIIFSMYNENISVSDQVETAIPKNLTYVKSYKTRDEYKSQLFRI